MVNIFDWIGDLVSRACRHEIWGQIAQYQAAQHRYVHRSMWGSVRSTFVSVPSVVPDRFHETSAAKYRATEHQHDHQNIWEPASHSTFFTETCSESYRYPESSTINPASGLPMIGNAGIDVLGNSFGFNRSSWDHHDSFASLGHCSYGGSLPSIAAPGYDPVRGW
jgi:hypothetical protein